MAGAGRTRVTSAPEASGCLVAPPVFKTGEPCTARLAGSIPVRLREGTDPQNGRRAVPVRRSAAGKRPATGLAAVGLTASSGWRHTRPVAERT